MMAIKLSEAEVRERMGEILKCVKIIRSNLDRAIIQLAEIEHQARHLLRQYVVVDEDGRDTGERI